MWMGKRIGLIEKAGRIDRLLGLLILRKMVIVF